MKRAAIYIRVSTPGQAEEDRVSLGEQERACHDYCGGKGYRVVAVYSDVGSGATKKRAQFLRMLKDARNGRFDVIVGWKADRLARGISPCAALWEALEGTAINVETVAEPFDRTTFEIRAVLGRMELENLAQRSLMGKKGAVERKGYHSSFVPYGWDYDKKSHRWVVNEFEAGWVRQMFRWYIEGVSTRQIALRLNEAGVPTKRRRPLGWSQPDVSKLLSREWYVGVAYYNKRRGNSKVLKDRKEWVLMDIPAIIDAETWEAARARRASNKKYSPRNTRDIYLTQHILWCEECGYRFVIDGSPEKRYLICYGVKRYPHLCRCRTPKRIDERTHSERLWAAVANVLGSEAGLEAAVRARVEYVARERQAIEGRLREIEKKRSRLKLEQDRVISWARKGIISQDQLQRQLQAIQAEEEQYLAEQDRLLADLALHSDARTVYQHARQLIPRMKRRLEEGLTLKEKRELVRLLVRRALLDGAGNLTVEFKVPAPKVSFGFSIPGPAP